MRKENEIKQALSLLRKKGDPVSLHQAEVISNRLNERGVFDKYVMCVPESERDESLFFAVRDAARFLKGDISLEVLIPGVEEIPVSSVPSPVKERKVVPYLAFQELERKVKQLEKLVDDLCKERRQRSEYQKRPDENRSDFISQQAAVEYVKCTRETLSSWQKKGYITGYRRAGRTYYSKSELESSSVVQNFIELKVK